MALFVLDVKDEATKNYLMRYVRQLKAKAYKCHYCTRWVVYQRKSRKKNLGITGRAVRTCGSKECLKKLNVDKVMRYYQSLNRIGRAKLIIPAVFGDIIDHTDKASIDKSRELVL